MTQSNVDARFSLPRTNDLSITPSKNPPSGLLALGLAGLCAFLNVYATQPLLPTLEQSFNVSKAEAALTISAPSAAVALAAPLFGFIADRYGQRRVIVASLFALVVPTALVATAPSIQWLVFWRFCQGLCVPGVYAIGIAYAARRFNAHELGKAMSSLVTGNVIGGFLGRTLTGQLAAVIGWQYSFLALALLTLLGALATWRHLPAEPSTPNALAVAKKPLKSLAPTSALFTSAVLSTFCVGFCVLFIQVALFTYVTFYLANAPFNLGPSALGAVFSVYLIGAFVTPLAGQLIDRVGSRLTMTLALGLGLLGAVITTYPGLIEVVVGLTLAATATFVGQSAAVSHLSQVVPEPLRARASGFYLSLLLCRWRCRRYRTRNRLASRWLERLRAFGRRHTSVDPIFGTQKPARYRASKTSRSALGHLLLSGARTPKYPSPIWPNLEKAGDPSG